MSKAPRRRIGTYGQRARRVLEALPRQCLRCGEDLPPQAWHGHCIHCGRPKTATTAAAWSKLVRSKCECGKAW